MKLSYKKFSLIRNRQKEVDNYDVDCESLEMESEEVRYERNFEPWYVDRDLFPILDYDEVVNSITRSIHTYSIGTRYLLGGQNTQFFNKYWMDNLSNPVIIVAHFQNDYEGGEQEFEACTKGETEAYH